MEIENHYDGNVPEDLTLSDYLQIKRKENEEWEQYEKRTKFDQTTENSKDDEKLDGDGSCS
jgi:hypothetical protein